MFLCVFVFVSALLFFKNKQITKPNNVLNIIDVVG